MTPQSAVAGSRLGTIDILVDEAFVDDIQYLQIGFYQYYHYVTHNNSGEELFHDHDIGPTFRLVANNTIPEYLTDYYSRFNSSSLTKLRDVPTAHCTYIQSAHNLTKFLILSIDIILQSDSLYHLGEHTEGIHGYLSVQRTDLQYFYFGTTLNLKVQAGHYSSSNEQLSHFVCEFLFADSVCRL